MSQSQIELDQLRTELAVVKQSTVDALTVLKAKKEVSIRANAAWATARVSESQA